MSPGGMFQGCSLGLCAQAQLRFLGSCFWEVRRLAKVAQSMCELLGFCFFGVRRMEEVAPLLLGLLGPVSEWYAGWRSMPRRCFELLGSCFCALRRMEKGPGLMLQLHFLLLLLALEIWTCSTYAAVTRLLVGAMAGVAKGIHGRGVLSALDFLGHFIS